MATSTQARPRGARPVPPPEDAVDRLVRLVHRHLTDDLRRSPWKGSADPLAGHCFVASEAIYYLLGGRAAGWKPLSMRHEGAPHWLLRHEPSGRVVDATEWQFRTAPDAACAVGKGFMSSRPDTPSARARELMRRVRADADGPRLIVAAFAETSAASRPEGPPRRANPADGLDVRAPHRYPRPERYGTPEGDFVRGTAHALKRAEPAAVERAARAMAALVPEGSDVVPVPGSDGSTSVNRRLAEAIVALRGGRVVDGLQRGPGESQHRRHASGLPRLTADEMPVSWAGGALRAPAVLVDNVVASGATLEACARALPVRAMAVVWADARVDRGWADPTASLRVQEGDGAFTVWLRARVEPGGAPRTCGSVYVRPARPGIRGDCGLDLMQLKRVVGFGLGLMEVYESELEPEAQGRGLGLAMYLRALQHAAARPEPAALMQSDCLGGTTSDEAKRVWERMREVPGVLAVGAAFFWRGEGERRANPPRERLPSVVFHGTPYDFDELRPSDTGLFWFALDREVAERFSVHRSYVPAGNAAVWETRLADGARVVDLADLAEPVVRALKENYSSTAYAARYGASLSDEDWVRHYANFATLEGERGVVKFLRSRRIDGAVVDDNLKGEAFRSLAIWNRRAIGPSVRVALGQAEQDAARARVRPRDATRSNPPRGAKARKLPKGFVTLEMPAGTDLWRGSANPGDWSESWQWFTDDAFAARGYMEGRDHEWGIVSFDTTRPLTLVSLRTYEDLDRLAARLGVRDYDGDPRDVAHAVCEIAGVDGWFIKEGDHDGADILLCAPDAIRPIAGVDQSDDWDWSPWPGY